MNIDSNERIARSNIYSIFGKLLKRQIKNNNDREIILKKAGLSSLLSTYKNQLEPYRFHCGYQNGNNDYNPEYACIKICESLEENEDNLLLFLNTILDGTNKIEDDLKEKFGELFETSNGDMITRVCKSIEKLRKLGSLKNEEKCS